MPGKTLRASSTISTLGDIIDRIDTHSVIADADYLVAIGDGAAVAPSPARCSHAAGNCELHLAGSSTTNHCPTTG
jgi:hypothetical protein